MMKKLTYLFTILLTLLFLNGIVFADPIDLSSWVAKDYNFTGGQPGSNWDLSNGNTVVTQTINADPSMYLNGISQTSYEMDGSWQVKTSSDNDFMGFVFGYQDESHFYIMDWKQGQQNYVNSTAYEGFTIKQIAANSYADLTLTDFWSSTNTANMTVLATSYGSDKGWADNTLYDFHLDFAPGAFNITVSLGATELWDVIVNDNTYGYGQFGFYNFSQSNVQYAGFEQTGGIIVDPVPEPATMLLLGLGLVGLAGFRKKFQK